MASCLLLPQPIVEKPLGKEAVPTSTPGLDAYALNVISISAPVPVNEAVVPGKVVRCGMDVGRGGGGRRRKRGGVIRRG